MRWRRAALALNGTADIPRSWEGRFPYATRPLGATRTDPCTKVAHAGGWTDDLLARGAGSGRVAPVPPGPAGAARARRRAARGTGEPREALPGRRRGSGRRGPTNGQPFRAGILARGYKEASSRGSGTGTP